MINQKSPFRRLGEQERVILHLVILNEGTEGKLSLERSEKTFTCDRQSVKLVRRKSFLVITRNDMLDGLIRYCFKSVSQVFAPETNATAY
jgi:hypothetical protein